MMRIQLEFKILVKFNKVQNLLFSVYSACVFEKGEYDQNLTFCILQNSSRTVGGTSTGQSECPTLKLNLKAIP
jgi:hypothetical protein